ncbi:hypothetical protein QO010_003706 [Caulobacter ginsengisoli]|uniref:Uncharacterized protein n=1 Tax=Caulobacter ginsengisoli TaxID=400775 RepID=A0ABU0IXY5_9CAUL|nr:DUF6880 family protein [Caulobacter ginsengisoli]MDQ0465914.1 hypothetical protein [Caulobacter ginsengisoli]
MARKPNKTTVTAENLTGLGAERLAAILMELAAGRADVKRRLKMELTGEVGSEELANEIVKRLAAIGKARTWIHWRKRPAFVRELDMLRAMIVERLVPLDAARALELLWRFRDLKLGLYGRMGEAAEKTDEIFRQTDQDLARLAGEARMLPAVLAHQAFEALAFDDDAGGLVVSLYPVLGAAGVAALRERLAAGIAEGHDNSASFLGVLRELADLDGDVDAWIATLTPREAQHPGFGAAAAERLLAAGRGEAALQALEASRPPERSISAVWRKDDLDERVRARWLAVYRDALEAVGRTEEAQALRWATFEGSLSTRALKDYLARLPEFDDVIAEDRAKAHAARFKSFHRALAFFLAWGDLAGAAALILARRGEIQGEDYDLLIPAASRLEGRYPLAATALRRAMIVDALDRARSGRYAQTARLMVESEAIAPSITDWGGLEPHEDFARHILIRHARKPRFLAELKAAMGG